MKFEERTVLHARPERVWTVLADWEAQASWMPDVAWIRFVGPNRELGARLAVRTKVLGVPMVTDELRVTVWDPPRRLAVEHRGLVRGGGEWFLDPSQAGTLFLWRESFTMPPPVLGDLALWAYSPIQRRTLRRSIRNLRRLVEGH
jgi:carbon monoxide dehydrogenase subunit G